jgi:phosphatidylinositol 3-kinase
MLLQALRHEASDDSPLMRFLVRRAVANRHLANYLHWFLTVEWEDPAFAGRFMFAHQHFAEAQVAEEGGSRVGKYTVCH